MPRILLVKTSSLGDVVHNFPVASDIARRVPGAVIDWVVEEPFEELVALHRSVRRVIPVAIRRWRGGLLSAATWADIGRFRRALRNEPYDFVIDSQGLVKSALVAAFARGRKHGFDRDSAREPFAAHFYGTRHAVPVALHAVERNRRLAAEALGYELDATCEYGLRVAADLPIEVPSPYALLFTMTSREDKLWPEANWRMLGSALQARGIQCLLPWGTEEEKGRSERIAAAVRGAIVPRRMTLAELARLAGNAHFVVGVDTGLAHLAVALEVPVVGLYRGSDPALTGLYAGGAPGAGRVRNLGGPSATPSVDDALAALSALGALQ
ncbi:MAG TPA: lipopolysaccharide heptosyltransferase I [Burkholderiales bacterium]|nr:lipopolysaccharide heptosyltransferase I [Burkholderiales bacterium]